MVEKNKSLWLAPIVVLLLLVFQQFASRTGGFVTNLFTYDRIDPYNLFAWVSVHHIVQMIIALAAILILAKAKGIDFGFGLGNVKVGLDHTWNFTIIIAIYVIVVRVVNVVFFSFSVPNFPLNITNVAGTLGFQLLLSGPAEEILFRALPIVVLAYSFKSGKSIKIDKKLSGVESFEVSPETVIASIFFTIAHIGWTINPFAITHLNIHQLILSFVVGIFYGVAFQKSKSVIYPMAMHSISNVLIVGERYISSFIFG